MAIRRHRNNINTTLSGGINNSVTAMTLASGTGLPTLSGGDEFYLTLDDGTNVEIVKVTAYSGANITTMVRAQEGTSANAFADGTTVQLRGTANSIDRKADLPSSNGVIVRTAADTTTNRTVTGTSNQITITNGDGVSGNPTIAIADNAALPGNSGNTLAQGSSGSRPAAGTFGRVRMNTSTGHFEYDDSSNWQWITRVPESTTSNAIPKFSGTNSSVFTVSGVTIDSSNNMIGGIWRGTSPCSFRAYRNGTQSVTNSSFTKIQLNAESYDVDSTFDSSTNYRFTPNVAGKYLIYAQVYIQSLTDAKLIVPAIYKNGSLATRGLAMSVGATQDVAVPAFAVVDMNGSTDYIELYAYQGDTAARDVLGSTDSHTYMLGFRVVS